MTFNSPDLLRNDLIGYPENYVKPKLTKECISLIENTKLLGLHEKLILLQLQTETRMAVESGYELRNYPIKDHNGHFIAPKDKCADHEDFLNQLPYPYVKVETIRENRHIKGTYERVFLYMVCINNLTREYISNYYQTFRDYEYGVIYGYPISAIQAYIKMLERHQLPDFEHVYDYTVAMKYIGPGFYSKKFFNEEKEYYNKIWKQLKDISPKLVDMATKEWEIKRNDFKPSKS
jgi:hypothetical protein